MQVSQFAHDKAAAEQMLWWSGIAAVVKGEEEVVAFGLFCSGSECPVGEVVGRVRGRVRVLGVMGSGVDLTGEQQTGVENKSTKELGLCLG